MAKYAIPRTGERWPAASKTCRQIDPLSEEGRRILLSLEKDLARRGVSTTPPDDPLIDDEMTQEE